MNTPISTRRVKPASTPRAATGWKQFLLVRMFSRRWIFATLLVIAVASGMVRLGFWQLDRLAARRAFNARVQEQLNQPVLVLDAGSAGLDLTGMEYRDVVVRGEYDFGPQVGLRNQAWENQWGVHLITPLRIEGSDRVILVERGWVPAKDFQYDDWAQYDEPGMVEVRGVIRASQSQPDFGRRSDPIPGPGDPPLKVWSFTNVEAIAGQMPYPLLPVYIQQAPDPAWNGMPYRSAPELDLTEGPHMGYALQWFAFACIALIGYPLLIHRREASSPPGRKSA